MAAREAASRSATLARVTDPRPADEELMLRYARGDAAAFDLLYGRHRAGLYRYFVRQCADRGAAEEMFQDVWSSLIQARGRYRPQARFATWLYTLAHNRLVDWYRRSSRVSWVDFGGDEDDPPPDPPAARTAQPDVQAAAREIGSRILAVLDALPPPQREAFLLHEEGAMSVEEIAAATGASLEAAKSRLRYAIARLRAGLRELA
ncbi:MAG: RNA polymerase sigma factor [Burkholderiales bacterium]|nr:RNA polymerase sigma factor [Burkholderiales bacterium]